MWKCTVCNSGIDATFTLECFDCKRSVHYNCTSLPMYQIFLLAKTNRRYTCEVCTRSNHVTDERHVAWIKAAEEARARHSQLVGGQHSTTFLPVQCSEASEYGAHNTLPSATTVDKTKVTPAVTTLTSSNQPPITSVLMPTPLLVHLDNTTVSPSVTTNIFTPQTQPQNYDQQLMANGANSSQPLPTTSQTNTGHDSRSTGNPSGQNRPVCEEYMKRKCNKGSRCRSGDHPTLCPLFMRGGNRENGCSRRPSDCPNGKHPHICNNSFNRRECYTRGCKYRHLPGTRTVRNAGDTQRPDSRLPRPQYATQGPPRNNAEFPPLTRPPYEPPRAPPPAWSGQARPDTTLSSNNQAQTFFYPWKSSVHTASPHRRNSNSYRSLSRKSFTS